MYLMFFLFDDHLGSVKQSIHLVTVLLLLNYLLML